MTDIDPYTDRLQWLAQAGGVRGVQLVRIGEVDSGNCYQARPAEFDSSGELATIDGSTLTVTNIAETPDSAGQVPAGSHACAVDVEGRWIVHLSPPSTSVFPAKVISADGGATYTVREQQISGTDTLSDAAGAVDVPARNLSELTLGPGGAVDVGAIVLVCPRPDAASPATLRYLFDHPVYARYLD